jgi:hypothetical protein
LAELSRREGDRLAVVGAVALFAVVVLSAWYGGRATVSSVPGVNVGGGFRWDGWQAFTNSRWIWLATVLLVLLTTVASVERPAWVAVAPRALVAALALLSTALIAYRIVHHRPGGAAAQTAFHSTGALREGIWLGLVAAAVTAFGTCLALYGAAAPALTSRGPTGGAP